MMGTEIGTEIVHSPAPCICHKSQDALKQNAWFLLDSYLCMHRLSLYTGADPEFSQEEGLSVEVDLWSRDLGGTGPQKL